MRRDLFRFIPFPLNITDTNTPIIFSIDFSSLCGGGVAGPAGGARARGQSEPAELRLGNGEIVCYAQSHVPNRPGQIILR